MEIQGLSSTITLAPDTSLIANNTSIIGDIYGNITGTSPKKVSSTFANLSFDTTGDNKTYYKGSEISLLKDGSKLSFKGKGSLLPSNPTGTDAKDKMTTITLAGNASLDLTLDNTAATVSMNQDITNTGGAAKGNFYVRGTNLIVENGLYSASDNINATMIFAKSSESTKNKQLLTSDNSLLTENSYISNSEEHKKDFKDYVESSSLVMKKTVALAGGDNHFTFIGDSSIVPMSKEDMIELSGNAKATINLINMGSALTTKDSTNTDATTEHLIADKIFASKANIGTGTANYVYNVFGSDIKNATIKAPTKTTDSKTQTINTTFNATFDSRNFNDRVYDEQKYWNDPSIIGDTKLIKATSSLSGKLDLGGSDADEQGRVTANLYFYGQNAFGKDASILGGSENSTLLIDGFDNKNPSTTDDSALKFDALKGFNGSINIINEQFSGNIEDKAGVSYKNTDGTWSTSISSSDSYEAKDKSKFKNFQITFNGTDLAKLPGESSDETNTLSTTAQKFVDDNILSHTKDSAGNTQTLDLNTKHQFKGQVGYTNKAVTLNFIGKDSISSYGYTKSDGSYSKATSGSGFVISNDNQDNIYNFIDFGSLDINLFSDSSSKINGSVIWVGNTWQLGKITNSLGSEDNAQKIDLDNLPDEEMSSNIYQAQDGDQHIVFDFGGDVLKADKTEGNAASDYKMDGSIQESDDSKDSSYIFSHLPKLDLSQSGSETEPKNIIDVLNTTINPKNTDSDKKPIQVSQGTIGVAGTEITGDIYLKNTNTSDLSKNIALDLRFDNTGRFNGHKIYGDAKKTVYFDGDNSFNKDSLKIYDGSKDSSYTFDNVGDLNQTTINNVMNGNGSSYTKGDFNFSGDSTLIGNITDMYNETSKDQNISIDNAKVIGQISTIVKVDAKFGVGSRVDIANKNGNSVYDFSAFANNKAPVIANIDLDSNKKAATIKGFDGSTSLIGSIKDTDVSELQNTTSTDHATIQTFVKVKTSNNKYVFGDIGKKIYGGKWIVTDNSFVKELIMYGNPKNFNTNGLEPIGFVPDDISLIDLRGGRALGSNTYSNTTGALLSGAVSDSTIASNDSFHSLYVDHLTMGFGLIRMGVDTADGVGDKLSVNKVEAASGNKLQVFLEGGDYKGFTPIVLADFNSDIRDNYFVPEGYTTGIYDITPIISVHKYKKDDTNEDITKEAAYNPTTGAYNRDIDNSQYTLDGFLINADTARVNPLQESLNTFYRGFRIATNNLNLRMGELRGIGANQGAWARVINGLGSDKSGNEDFYTTLQAGYDYKFDVLGGVNYLGVDAEATLLTSKGSGYSNSGRNLGLGIYNTYVMDNGFYVDASMKYLNLSQRISIKEPTITSPADSVYSNAFLLGGEVGYRYGLDTLMTQVFGAPKNIYTLGYFVEPQVELIYGYIGSSQYNMTVSGSDYSATLMGDNALISRVGAVLGKTFKTNTGLSADVRLGLSYINEINTGGDTKIMQTGSAILPAVLSSTPSNNKLNLSLGTNIAFNDSWRMYADISRTFLGVYNFDYNLNIGARFSFGAKENARAKNIRYEKQQQKDQRFNTEINQIIKNKQTYQSNKSLKVGCQGCAPEEGLYLQVAVLVHQDPSIMKLFEKYSYRVIPFAYKDKKGNTMQAKRYLIGPFKDIQAVYSAKPQADRIVQAIDKNPKAYSVMWEVK
ncbi:autotransporter outer membrane beta-barrel domain-containing protein [Helicobacter sp. 13S00477-4]|uniref:autotransporter outer membrane beta-barrel domain-containing protein n=1 Tax=Helicobacter sp. 13S00477-4 TaxID=1905759 RepID=UPI000BA516AB|nr:autotransporter outer membrane beta-barrel domain-containing protein [Helicobacter sp. 13S00477-4]PAF52816.1 hypothetical protein BKH44_01130 [Helicobacter sp. 13S00477-4]